MTTQFPFCLGQNVGEGLHAAVELLTLVVLGLGILMQLKWRGLDSFVRHTRSMLKASTAGIRMYFFFRIHIFRI